MTTISNKLAPAEVVAKLNGLATDRAAWENGAYKASNDELYGLLDRCFSLLEQMKGQRKLIKELNELLTEKGIVFNEVICPLLGGPISILELATKEEWNGKEAQTGGDHR